MDQNDIHIDKSLDKALDFLNDADSFSEEEFECLMKDDESLRDCKDLMDCRNAVAQEYTHAPDVAKEWERFNEHHKLRRPRYFLWGTLSGMVASILLFFLFSWFIKNRQNEGVTVFQANNMAQQVMLQTSSGTSIALNDQTKQRTVGAVGSQLTTNNDTLMLKYGAVRKVEFHTLTTPRGKDFKVVLADGTTVWLNAESRLTYPSRFTGKQRAVQLVGEAYFKVSKDKAHPFIVQTTGMQTRVLGTEFNIRNYSASDSHVTLIQGSVEVRGSKRGSFVRIKPGEDALLQPNGSFKVEEVDVDGYSYWKEGFFYFDNVPFVDVMQSLGRWYNVNVVFINKAAMNYHLHYLCDRKSGIDEAVKLLNKMSHISVKIENNTIYVQ